MRLHKKKQKKTQQLKKRHKQVATNKFIHCVTFHKNFSLKNFPKGAKLSPSFLFFYSSKLSFYLANYRKKNK